MKILHITQIIKVLLANSKNQRTEPLVNEYLIEYLVELNQLKIEGREKLINMT